MGEDFLKFLGTGGARVVITKQIRHSGGIWLSVSNCQMHIDPGPGALIRVLSSKQPKLSPLKLDCIILSHKHLDHCADINVMIEAMTDGGFKKRGLVICPEDAISPQDSVVFRYARSYIERIEIIREKSKIKIKNIQLYFPIAHIHGNVETFGIKILTDNNLIISHITDTRFFDELCGAYSPTDILIINVLRLNKDKEIDHLCIDDVKELIKSIKPRLAILTHFGMTLIKAKPHILAEKLSDELGTKIIASTDGMKLALDEGW